MDKFSEKLRNCMCGVYIEKKDDEGVECTTMKRENKVGL
jgi:hypothetical protein